MKRTILLLAAALLAMAAAAPAASAGKSHVLKLYKAEKHVDLEGEDGTYTVTCPNGDYALDGMWRVDNAGQDADFGTVADLLTAVRPVAAYSTAKSTYTFRFLPVAGGDVQVKLFATCMDKNTSGHDWVLSDPQDAGAGDVDVTTVANTEKTHTAGNCTVNSSILVAPGFEVRSGDSTLVGSVVTPGSTYTKRTWTWFGAGPATIDQTWRCLRLKSDPSGSPAHSHRIVRNLKSASGTVPAESTGEVAVHCGEHYKGTVGGFDLTGDSTHGAGFEVYKYVWYLGMDPRIKTRAFRFVNKDTVAQTAKVQVVCFKDRTT